jgi:hypothetical protein
VQAPESKSPGFFLSRTYFADPTIDVSVGTVGLVESDHTADVPDECIALNTSGTMVSDNATHNLRNETKGTLKVLW